MAEKRQLAAIMFTDIEGYTKLMHQNESEAVLIREKHREIFNTLTGKYNGKIIQYFGDGTLSIFRSSVEAVACAIEMQQAFQESPVIPVRIGIHVGDIITSKDDIIGNAVNIASRIESCAIPGSVLISDKVHDQTRNHEQFEFKFLDAYELKNVEGTMPIFALANKGLTIPDAKKIKGKLRSGSIRSGRPKKLSRGGLILIISLLIALASIIYVEYLRPAAREGDFSIAVLPFKNLSNQLENDIFSDGITEDILTQLSKLKDIHVISRTSVMHYKNSSKTIPEIAKELGVNYVLDGSLRKFGNDIRVSAQLIDARNDEHIWADNYDRTLVNILSVQAEVAQKIAMALELNISNEDIENLATIPTENIQAYEFFLKGRNEADKRTRESIAKSIEYYEKAIAIDTNYAEAYAEIANSTFLQTYYGGADPEEATEKAEIYLRKAEKLNNKLTRIYTVKGLLLNHQKQYEAAKEAFEKAISLSPNDVTARYQYATFFYYTDQYERQLEQAEIAYKLDPLSFAAATNYFSALIFNAKYKDAEDLIGKIENEYEEADRFTMNRLYMRLYMSKPDYKKAIPVLTELAEDDPAYFRFLGYSYGQTGDTLSALKTIKEIKAKDGSRLENHRIAVVFAGIELNDSVYYYLDTTRNKTTLFNDDHLYFFNYLKGTERYNQLLKEHGISEP
ncbi:adenylate/guanylate cyclase domain-containing protein [Robertkochia solimangrovi]|uniref:adenylate/guanylate cyclase domain-containing protein n=1 Tax=Robertkochia solimangrovi TaxID=2213046 RepID=UPI0013A55344|nr:adenylate/guanylate cyclase domain-containing protein [Robertkochia solimangrovi]